MADLRIIPSIEQLRQRDGVIALERTHGVAATTDALRHAAADLRRALTASGGVGGLPRERSAAAADIERRAHAQLVAWFRGSLRPVVNATGVIVHTNLGRAPLATPAIARLTRIASGYTNLEYDLDRGGRGSRTVHAETLLTALTGAEAAVVVNNNAAATLLILSALAAGREVIVSRGELVEIGGGFRVPDIMAQSGAVLREVGTTNRTRVADYRAAIGARSAMLLRVHPSNYRIEGFTERPTLTDLIATAHEASLPLVEDLGSGLLRASLGEEPLVPASVGAGVDLVCFSGDKLLGGPQAGIVAGTRELVERLRTHPLMRAVRVDKLTLAALEGTLIEYLAGRENEIPVVRMFRMTRDEIAARARTTVERLDRSVWTATLIDGASTVGGGSAPGVELPTVLIALEHAGLSADRLEARLRSLDPPIVARVEDDRVVLDLRTVREGEDEVIVDALHNLRPEPRG